MARKGGAPENLKPFKKGHDPRRNMNGVPPKLPQLDILLAKVLGEEKNDISAAEAILQALRARATRAATSYDIRAAEILLERAFGKVKQDVGIGLESESIHIVKTILNGKSPAKS